MRTLITIICLLPILSFACPDIQGNYPHCHSEIKQMKGDYTVSQFLEAGVEVYGIKYTDEAGNIQEDEFRTDGTTTKRNHEIPTIGVTVTVVGNATCNGDNVISNGKAYFLGANVGNYSTTIFKVGSELQMKIVAQYLGKTVHKLIQCKE